MIKNIILDMGNVLINFDPEVPLHTFFDTDSDRDIIRLELFQSSEWVQGDYGYITNEQRYEPVSKRVPERLHPQLKKCIEKWPSCMTPVSGAISFCNYAKEKGYHLYVLSNADKNFDKYFPTFVDPTYFDGIMVSSYVNMIKPELRIYQHFLETYHLTADECLFLDDREENIEGARKVGIHGFVFTGDFGSVIKEYNL